MDQTLLPPNTESWNIVKKRLAMRREGFLRRNDDWCLKLSRIQNASGTGSFEDQRFSFFEANRAAMLKIEKPASKNLQMFIQYISIYLIPYIDYLSQSEDKKYIYVTWGDESLLTIYKEQTAPNGE
jgi:hypothetical protein